MYNISRGCVHVLIVYCRLLEAMYLAWWDFWRLVRSSSLLTSSTSFFISPLKMRLSCPRLSVVTKAGCTASTQNKARVLPMEKPKFTETGKRRIRWQNEDCSLRISPARPITQYRIILWHFTATLWTFAKTSNRTLATKLLLYHYNLMSSFSPPLVTKKRLLSPQPPYSSDLAPFYFSISTSEDSTILTQLIWSRQNRRLAEHHHRTGFPRGV